MANPNTMIVMYVLGCRVSVLWKSGLYQLAHAIKPIQAPAPRNKMPRRVPTTSITCSIIGVFVPKH
mgnify:CR=1 FL=1